MCLKYFLQKSLLFMHTPEHLICISKSLKGLEYALLHFVNLNVCFVNKQGL